MRKYYRDMALGSGFEALRLMLGELQNSSSLKTMFFRCSGTDLQLVGPDIDEDVFVGEEDMWSEKAAHLALSITFHRCRSYLWHTDSLPGLFGGLLAEAKEDRALVLQEIRSMWNAYKMARGQNIAEVVKGVKRSFMDTAIVREACEACELADWSGDLLMEQLQSMAASIFSMGTTKHVEDSFQRCRFSEQHYNASKTISDQTVWMAPVQRHVLDEVHSYTAVKAADCSDKMAVGLGGKLESALFYPAISRCHLKLKDIIGTTSAAPWVTFSALSQSVQYAEVAMWRECVDTGLWNTCMDAWLCLVLQRGLLVRRKATETELAGKWVWSLGDVRGMMAIGWPSEATEYKGVTYCTPSSSPSAKRVWLMCKDPADWEAQPVRWCSPLRTLTLARRAKPMSTARGSGDPLGARMVEEAPVGAWAEMRGSPMPLWEAVGRNAFFSLPTQALQKLALWKNVELPPGCTFFQVLKLLVVACVPGIEGEDLLAILHKRNREVDADIFELLGTDAVKDCFGKSDAAQLQAYHDAVPQLDPAFQAELKVAKPLGGGGGGGEK